MSPERLPCDRARHVWSEAPALLAKRVAATAYIASVICSGSAALAQNAISPPGRLLASNCLQCHGTTHRAPGFEKLTGKSANKLYRKLKKYQSGAEGENIMVRHAMGFTDAQLRDIAQWLSAQQ